MAEFYVQIPTFKSLPGSSGQVRNETITQPLQQPK